MEKNVEIPQPLLHGSKWRKQQLVVIPHFSHKKHEVTEKLTHYPLASPSAPSKQAELWIKSCGEGNGTPLQYSCLENPMDRGTWKAAVHGVAEGQTQLSDFTFTFMHWRRKWQSTPVFLPGESQGRGSLVGCRLWGGTESDNSDLATYYDFV